MMGLKKRNKPKESTNVQIKLNVTVSDTENSNSCNIVDSLLNDIWNIALEKEGVEAQSMSSKYNEGENSKMMYLSMAIHNIAVMIFTAYMVIHVHPIWAVCILFTYRIGTKIVRVPIESDEDNAVDDVYGMDWNEEDDSKNSSRDEF